MLMWKEILKQTLGHKSSWGSKAWEEPVSLKKPHLPFAFMNLSYSRYSHSPQSPPHNMLSKRKSLILVMTPLKPGRRHQGNELLVADLREQEIFNLDLPLTSTFIVSILMYYPTVRTLQREHTIFNFFPQASSSLRI